MDHDLAARYAAAEALLGHRTAGLVTGGAPYVRFTGTGDEFVITGPAGPLLVDPESGTTAPAPAPGIAPLHESPEGTSPDGRWALALKDGNLVLQDLHTGTERQLTSDADHDVSYAQPPDATSLLVRLAPLGRRFPVLVRWSPDSQHFFTQRVNQSGVRRVDLVEAAPPDGGDLDT